MSDNLSEERKRTNNGSLHVCVAFVVVLLSFVGYTFFNGSVYRIINGYDDCGNVCGMKNDKNTISLCGANDKRSYKFLKVDILHNECVQRCEDYPGYKQNFNRCILKFGVHTPDISAFAQDLVHSWWPIFLSCGVAFVFSYIILLLFRFAIKYVIWVICFAVIALFALASFAMLVLYCNAANGNIAEEKTSTIYLIASGLLAVIAAVIGLLLFYFKTRIRLVIVLFKEASKALIDMPMLMFEPVLTFAALGFTWFLYFYFVIVIESSGNFVMKSDWMGKLSKVHFEKTPAMVIAQYLNEVAFLWFTSFILACQHFVTASAVSEWYFSRTKDKLDAPIARGFNRLLRFHLGSVCLGSILITLIRIIRIILTRIKKLCNIVRCRCFACCFDWILRILEDLMKYLVRNAFIIVAKDGTPLLQSGVKAFGLLSRNLVDVVFLNKIGDFVLCLARVFVILITAFVSFELSKSNEGLNYQHAPLIVGTVLAFLIIHCFMTVFEMTLDTIFICYCEDSEENDGESRPYFMSPKMMQVMQELKQGPIPVNISVINV